ncbi:MAG: ADP-ribosylation factor-directed GTPase activating protein isoform b [Pirellulales bacterium]
MVHRIVNAMLLAALPWFGGCSQPRPENEHLSSSKNLPSDEELKQLIHDALAYTYSERHLSLDEHAAWQILHGALPFGTRFMVYNDDERVSAVHWVLDGHQMKGWTLQHGQHNLPHGRQGLKMVLESGTKAGQGHEDQWLAVLSQCNLPLDQKVIFQGKEYIVEDILQQSMWDVYEGKECSWTAIALVNYLEDLETEWKNSDGDNWTLERMIAMEADRNINRSACGGTHRLIGMTMALGEYRRRDGKLEAGWKKADQKIQESIVAARRYQQPDGSFSTHYFVRPGTSPDFALRINTTGHTLEFLALALDDRQLGEPWVTHAVASLCKLFKSTKAVSLECGSLYHATHGLIEYYERRFGPWQYPDVVAEGTEAESDDLVGVQSSRGTP